VVTTWRRAPRRQSIFRQNSSFCAKSSLIPHSPPSSHTYFFPMNQSPQLSPQLTRILLQAAAPHASLLAFVADGCDDDDIPSLALLRPAKLQSKYNLSPQQALHFASLCAAHAAAASSSCPAPGHAVHTAALLSSDLPELVEVDLDTIIPDNNEPPMKLNPRTASASPRRSSAQQAPPLDPGAVLDALQLKIVRRSAVAFWRVRFMGFDVCSLLFGLLFERLRLGLIIAQDWRRRLWRRLLLPQRQQKRRLRGQNRARARVRRRIRSAEAGAMLPSKCGAIGPCSLQPAGQGLRLLADSDTLSALVLSD
jgi:hypothetical protein